MENDKKGFSNVDKIGHLLNFIIKGANKISNYKFEKDDSGKIFLKEVNNIVEFNHKPAFDLLPTLKNMGEELENIIANPNVAYEVKYKFSENVKNIFCSLIKIIDENLELMINVTKEEKLLILKSFGEEINNFLVGMVNENIKDMINATEEEKLLILKSLSEKIKPSLIDIVDENLESMIDFAEKEKSLILKSLNEKIKSSLVEAVDENMINVTKEEKILILNSLGEKMNSSLIQITGKNIESMVNATKQVKNSSILKSIDKENNPAIRIGNKEMLSMKDVLGGMIENIGKKMREEQYLPKRRSNSFYEKRDMLKKPKHSL